MPRCNQSQQSAKQLQVMLKQVHNEQHRTKIALQSGKYCSKISAGPHSLQDIIFHHLKAALLCKMC